MIAGKLVLLGSKFCIGSSPTSDKSGEEGKGVTDAEDENENGGEGLMLDGVEGSQVDAAARRVSIMSDMSSLSVSSCRLALSLAVICCTLTASPISSSKPGQWVTPKNQTRSSRQPLISML